MATYANHEELLTRLRALYDQGYDQNEFSECIERCERSLESGLAPYWRIKIHCILVGANKDWNKAEEWRQAVEAVYRTILTESQSESSGNYPSTKELRACLDDVYAYQAEDAPSWFFDSKKLGEEDEDAEEGMSQFDGADDAEEDEDVDEDMGGLESVEATESMEPVESKGEAASSVQEMSMDVEQSLPGGAEAAVGSMNSIGSMKAVGGAKKKPSLASRAKKTWIGKQFVRRTQSTEGAKDRLAKRDLEKTLTSRMKAAASSALKWLSRDDKKDGQFWPRRLSPFVMLHDS